MTDANNQFTCNSCGEVFTSCPDESQDTTGEQTGVICPLCGSKFVTQQYSTNKGYTCNVCS